ncbi:MAG: serine acetyltransferase [Ruminococcaceae bacterium]|nr:serine acetyltransferase [Oscillospiraceae bacterium]
MIKDKQDLRYYLECDRLALGKKSKGPSLFGDEVWKFQICMRKLAYYSQKGSVRKWCYRFKYHKLSIKLGFSIPHNVIGPGLAIVHYGTIIISQGSTIGKNCRIHAGVNIGANAGEEKAATIEDNVYIGPGAKIIGAVRIGENAVIGANAVVTKDVPAGVTVGGVPASVISQNDSEKHLIKATEIIAAGGDENE